MLGGAAAGVRGLRCDVAVAGDVAALFAFAKREMGGIDVAINNAGCNFSAYAPLELHSADAIARIVGTNVVGTLLCCREAIQCMKRQPAGGHIFNIDGAGSAQHATPSYAVYGCSKAGFPQLMRSLVAENRDTGVGIHTASPGMVTTDLLLGKADLPKRSLRIFNILAERPETVAAWMVPRLRAIALRGLHATELARKATAQPAAATAVVSGADAADARAAQPGAGRATGGNDVSQATATPVPLDLPAARTLSGTYTKFLTPASAIWRFALFPWARNRLVDEATGVPIAVAGSVKPPSAR
jgi:NAD(P)-dependent dehydrogenase (short-subunit alcohol dehydrogenase family)